MERQIMTTAKRFFLTTVLAAMAMPLLGYDNVVTHPQMTMFATQKSVLYKDKSIMFNLGLLPADKQLFSYRARVGDSTWFTPNIDYGLSSFIGEATYDEDTGSRPVNHFFDPKFDRALTLPFLGVLGQKSWRWATEDEGPVSNSQEFSLADAREYLKTALTSNQGAPADADNQRGVAMAKMFLSLGHAVHHIQDMAQPQHVRNDQHLEFPGILSLILGFATNPSRYEKYTAERGTALDSFAAAGIPVFPGNTDYKAARDFWFNTANSGLAQYTNSNFVSQGTNFTMRNGQPTTSPYTSPQPGVPFDFKIGELFAESGLTLPSGIQTLCGVAGVDCTMTMYTTAISPRASTLSIFDQDLRARGVYAVYVNEFSTIYQSDRLFDLNRFNFDDAHKYLIGQAVGYSTGLINHFLRGKLDVTAPSSGPYAVTDQSTGQGFTKVRVTVRNATPNEALSSGTVQAIAHFHRNNCYKPDLSGEFTEDDTGGLTPPCPNYRSTEAHIRLGVTDQNPSAFAVGESKELTFTFSDPIPLDATDLIIQVYFQGKVGSESNTFALGAVDVSEPTFVAIMNATDVFELNAAAFYYYTDIIANITQSPYSIIDLDHSGTFNPPRDVDVRGGDISYQIKVNGDTVGSVPTLSEGRFARIAALVNPGGFEVTLIAVGNGFNDIDNYEFHAKTAQYDPDRNLYIISTVDLLRDQTLQFDSVSYYHFYPTTGAPLDDMPISRAANALTPVPVQMTP
jgi:hypothetical protein